MAFLLHDSDAKFRRQIRLGGVPYARTRTEPRPSSPIRIVHPRVRQNAQALVLLCGSGGTMTAPPLTGS